MTANRMADAASPKTAGRPLKSPLAAHSHGTARGRVPDLAGSATQGGSRDGMTTRAVTLADYADYLRTTNNRKGRPYEDKTVENYFLAGKALDTWLTAQGIDGDFTVCDTVMLNLAMTAPFGIWPRLLPEPSQLGLVVPGGQVSQAKVGEVPGRVDQDVAVRGQASEHVRLVQQGRVLDEQGVRLVDRPRSRRPGRHGRGIVPGTWHASGSVSPAFGRRADGLLSG